MPGEFPDEDEYFYRAVSWNPDMWKPTEGRPSSAVFKDSGGMSVDRQNGRAEAACIQFLLDSREQDHKETRAIVAFTGRVAREAGTYLKITPRKNEAGEIINPHHCEITQTADLNTLTPKMAKKIRDNSVLVHNNLDRAG